VTSTTAALPVIVAAVVVIMVVAHLSSGLERAIEVLLGDDVGVIPPNAGHHLDAVLGEDARSAWPHAACENDGCALLAQPHREYSPTVFGWNAEQAFPDRATGRIRGVKGKGLGPAKMFTEPAAVERNRNFHIMHSFSEYQ
jgi:hypothetical protein